MTMFEATAKLEIREGELEAFKQQAAEVIRLMSEQDDKPLRYDWFLSDDGTECEVREAYENADALLAHQQLVAEAKLKLFRDSVAGHTMSFYDDLSLALAHALEAMGTPYQRFAFLQGLETEDKVPDQVTA
jgi:quinol monooxygenase YgiN